MVLGLLVFLCSNGAPTMLRGGEVENFGQLMNYKSIMAYLAAPTVMLFLGGFFLAAAATKYRLDINLARILLKTIW